MVENTNVVFFAKPEKLLVVNPKKAVLIQLFENTAEMAPFIKNTEFWDLLSKSRDCV